MDRPQPEDVSIPVHEHQWMASKIEVVKECWPSNLELAVFQGCPALTNCLVVQVQTSDAIGLIGDEAVDYPFAYLSIVLSCPP